MTPQGKWYAAIDAHHEDIENGASTRTIAERVGCGRETVRAHIAANPDRFPRATARAAERLARREHRIDPPPKEPENPNKLDKYDYCPPAALRAVRMRWGTSQERPK